LRFYSRRAFIRDAGVALGALTLARLRNGAAAMPVSAASRREQASALADLAQRLTGNVLLPGDPGYDAASAPANGRYRGIRPLAVAQCADEQDVVTSVNWSRENGIPPVPRGGGHSYAGLSTTTGLLIDIGNLNGVSLDMTEGFATTGGAALNKNLFDATVDGPLYLPGGTCFGVGVGGLVLGGGIGYNTHWAGLTSDHLQASRIVTASGDLLQLDAANNCDLFWACRGGAGGNFGINTSFTFDLVGVPQTVSWYRFDWRGADAAGAVLSAFHQILKTAPPAFNAVVAAQASEVGPGGPREAIDTFSRGQYIGPIDELRDLVAPLLAASPPVKQTLQPMSFWDVIRMISTPEPESHSFGDISRYAAEPLPAQVTSKLIDVLAECPSRTDDANGSIFSLGWVGGDVMNAIGRTDTAYVHRGMMTLLRPTTVWPDDAPDSVGEGLNAWTDEVIAIIAPYTPVESYQNFPNRSLQNWQQLYYAENYPRLVQVKQKYDPADLFQNPQSIGSA
jgi:FAD/FMN-containing dehydrogenase